jgi:hypothetical protein
MKMTEAQLRKVIRQELLKEMSIDEKLHVGAIARGLGAAGAMVAVERLMTYIQESGVGGELADKLLKLSHVIQQAVQE